MGWDLLKEHRPFLAEEEIEPALSRLPRALQSDWKTFKAGQAEIELQLVKRVRLDLKEELILVEVPVDFYGLLHETANLSDELKNIPVNWRFQSREVFLNYFGQGYEAVDFLKARSEKAAVYYLLKKKQ
jgi:predicted GNAT superfamily acetyltransferase